MTRIGALCLAAEVFDWRRFPRARPFMSFTGLVPGENSTGLTQRRGSITRAGNAHLRGEPPRESWRLYPLRGWVMPRSPYSPEVRERAVRMYFDHRAEYPSEWAAMTGIAGSSA